jgi:ribosomal protein S18 acetylase RimI-like enzyme
MMGDDQYNQQFTFEQKTSGNLEEEEFVICYKMIRRLRHMYISSGMGWNAREKKAEMKMDGMQYLLVRKDNHLIAFASFVLDDELDDGTSVTYLYELHVDPTYRGSGLGTLLMERIRNQWPNSIALTVFNVNGNAIRFYKQLGFKSTSSSSSPSSSSSSAFKRSIGWQELIWNGKSTEKNSIIEI